MAVPRILWFKKSRSEWLQEIPELIHLLVKDFHFFYPSHMISKISDIVDVVNRKYEKNKHKVIPYYNPDRSQCYIVVYCNNFVKIYYCNEYDFSNWYTVKYFIEKFSKAGEIEDDYEQIKEVPLFEHDR